MILLALSSSGPFPSAALCEDGKLLAYCEGETGHTHSETLMPLLDALLRENRLSAESIDVFSADIGPGSFTGVRIGVCAVNAMASVFHKKLVGVSALEAMSCGISGRVCSMIDARNRSVYAAVYENGCCILPPEAAPLDDWLLRLKDCTHFIGDGAIHYADAIKAQNPNCHIENAALRADHVALLAFKHWQNGEAADEILPLYLRASQAERLYEEKHGEHTVS